MLWVVSPMDGGLFLCTHFVGHFVNTVPPYFFWQWCDVGGFPAAHLVESNTEKYAGDEQHLAKPKAMAMPLFWLQRCLFFLNAETFRRCLSMLQRLLWWIWPREPLLLHPFFLSDCVAYISKSGATVLTSVHYFGNTG